MKFRYNTSLLTSVLPLFVLLAHGASAQTGQGKDAESTQRGETVVLKTSTQLVVVDVVVQDSNGHPVHGLTADNFHISENKSDQTTRQFEEHGALQTTQPQDQGKLDLPPGMFTDYSPGKGNGPLNILLLDTVNTPPQDQLYVRDQLKDFVKHAAPNTKTAILAMNADGLVMLQGFTTDPRILKDAVEHKLDLTTSTILGGRRKKLIRVDVTLDTLSQLARYFAAFPGRKNLMWFSASFPLESTPDPTNRTPYDVSEQYREMTNLFARAQIAVYPISTGGLTGPMNVDPTARRPGSRNAGNTMSAQLHTEVDNHSTMDKMADDTGGRAVYNNNDISDAIKNAIDAGANYYTLAYSPTDHNWDGHFRAIHVDMTGPAAGRKLKLSYRRGYYADDPSAEANKTAAQLAQSNTPDPISISQARAALSYGAPAPTDIVFKVKVLPASSSTEATVAPNNHPSTNAKGPYQRYSVDYAAITRTFSWKTYADGQMECDAELGALVYDHEGHLVNSVTQPFHYKLSAADYKLLTQQGMQLHLEVSAPAKDNASLRIAIHDLNDDKFGVVEVPTSAVEKLTPAL